jgi:hypothetical protein
VNHLAAILALSLAAVACGGKPRSDASPSDISVLPASVVLAPGAVQRFTAAGFGTDQVSWAVREGDTAGIISSDGIYRAPPAPGIAHVVATSSANPGNSAAAEVVIAAPVSVAVAPSLVSLQIGSSPVQFTAAVTGAADTAVTWSVVEGAVGGAIDASGRYTPANSPGGFHVVASSRADPSKFAVAGIQITGIETDLIDHGGPIFPMTRTFLLFWGETSAFPADARGALEALLGGLQGSSYLGVVEQYLRGASASTGWAGTFFDSSTAPSDEPSAVVVGDAACRALSANAVTPRAGDFVVISTSNFPGNMAACAWHSSTTCSGQTVLFAYVPNPQGSFCGTTPDTCGTHYSSATTGLLLSTSHELLESITNPLGTAWWTKAGFEMVDNCGEVACSQLSTGALPLPTAYSNAAHACVSH